MSVLVVRHKLQAAVHMLMGMGFSFKAAEDAARTTGANAELAAQLLLDGGVLQLMLTPSAII